MLGQVSILRESERLRHFWSPSQIIWR